MTTTKTKGRSDAVVYGAAAVVLIPIGVALGQASGVLALFAWAVAVVMLVLSVRAWWSAA